jgi:hypothetical protein
VIDYLSFIKTKINENIEAMYLILFLLLIEIILIFYKITVSIKRQHQIKNILNIQINRSCYFNFNAISIASSAFSGVIYCPKSSGISTELSSNIRANIISVTFNLK